MVCLTEKHDMISYLVVAALQACHQLCLVVVALLSALKRLFNVYFVVRSHLSFAGHKIKRQNQPCKRSFAVTFTCSKCLLKASGGGLLVSGASLANVHQSPTSIQLPLKEDQQNNSFS